MVAGRKESLVLTLQIRVPRHVELLRRMSVTEHMREKAAKGRIELKQRIKSEAFFILQRQIFGVRGLSLRLLALQYII